MLSVVSSVVFTLLVVAVVSFAVKAETVKQGFTTFTRKDDYVRRIADPDLFYAAESRNYPEAPDTLFVTMRGGGVKVFDISEPAELKAVSQWKSDRPVEGQDRVGDLIVVAELGLGPNGAFDTSTGPALHLFQVQEPLQEIMAPFFSVDLSAHIDAILHVKFVSHPPGRPNELWAVCSGGFATTVEGAVVLVNLTAVATPEKAVKLTSQLSLEVSVLATPVGEPEGVMVAPSDSSIVYIGGITSHDLGVVDISTFSAPVLVELQRGVGMQLVGATRKDQPSWSSGMATVEAEDWELVYMAGWGARGNLAVLNTSNAAHPSVQCRTPPSQDLKLAMANRVKLYCDWALVPLETPLGGFAVVDISSASVTRDGRGDSSKVSQVVSVHVPPEETKASADGSVVSAKAYCLAVSQSRHIYLFIAETAAVYVYSLNDVLKDAGIASSDAGCDK